MENMEMEKIGAEAEEVEEAGEEIKTRHDKRLSKHEAHTEANLLLAQAGAGSKLNNMPDEQWRDFFKQEAVGTHAPSAQDYEEALAVVEELQALAADQMFISDKSIANILARHKENIRFIFEKGLFYFPLPGDATEAERKHAHDMTMARLGDAQKILTELEEKAEQFER
jgi:hypothetical protein